MKSFIKCLLYSNHFTRFGEFKGESRCREINKGNPSTHVISVLCKAKNRVFLEDLNWPLIHNKKGYQGFIHFIYSTNRTYYTLETLKEISTSIYLFNLFGYHLPEQLSC